MTRIRDLASLEETPHADVFPEAEPKTVRLRLDAGERIPPHRHPDRDVVFYLVDGAVDLELDGESHPLEAGEIARFAGTREVSPVAREPSTALVVLAATARSE
ncbi:MAG: cupin domain-containing protein [Haloquadratum sp.]